MQVPGRPSGAELKAMALRQQQQIDSQHQLLAAKEQRLRFLKAQEIRGAAAAAESERLRRLRERVEAQESKLRRLRALRGQVDLQKTYNVTLSKFFLFTFNFISKKCLLQHLIKNLMTHSTTDSIKLVHSFIRNYNVNRFRHQL